jgi:hypothetical protein
LWDDAEALALHTQRHVELAAEKFSSATAAVSSTTWGSEKCRRTSTNSSSLTFWPVIVIASAYASAARSAGEKWRLVANEAISRSLSSDAPSRRPREELMSIQNGQPLMSATRR